MVLNVSDDQYTLNVGQKGKERLDIQNEIYNLSTQQFLVNNGLKKGMHVLEVGCGTGQFACWLADMVGPTGRVVAIDNSEEQLELAVKLAQDNKLTNIEFQLVSIYELEKLSEMFDIVFSRWVITHLLAPVDGLKAMYNKVKDTGLLINEVTHLDSVFTYPKLEVIDLFHDVWLQAIKHHGKDVDFAYKMPGILTSLGAKITNIKLHQPIANTIKARLLLSLTIKEAKRFILQAQISSEEEINDLIKKLEHLAYEQEIIIGLFRSMQVASIKLQQTCENS